MSRVLVFLVTVVLFAGFVFLTLLLAAGEFAQGLANGRRVT
jgi:hypothetical protein